MDRDLRGMKFGRLTVLERAEDYISPDGRRRAMWRCRCECGNEKITRETSLISGCTCSCGCYQKEVQKESTSKHNHYGERLYHVWDSLRQRCNNVKNAAYDNYGGRGIRVCDEWSEYMPFREWSYKHGYDDSAKRGECTLDRIDVDGDYSPDNCRWSGMKEQSNNRRNSINITYRGDTRTLSEWADYLGVKYGTIWRRYKRGLPIERVLAV